MSTGVVYGALPRSTATSCGCAKNTRPSINTSSRAHQVTGSSRREGLRRCSGPETCSRHRLFLLQTEFSSTGLRIQSPRGQIPGMRRPYPYHDGSLIPIRHQPRKATPQTAHRPPLGDIHRDSGLPASGARIICGNLGHTFDRFLRHLLPAPDDYHMSTRQPANVQPQVLWARSLKGDLFVLARVATDEDWKAIHFETPWSSYLTGSLARL